MPTCSSLPSYPSKDLKFGSKCPLPTLQKPKLWPKAGASGNAPISRVLLHSHRKIPKDGAATKRGPAFPSLRHSPAVPSSPTCPQALPGTEQPDSTQMEGEEGAEDGEARGEKDTAQAAPHRHPQGSPQMLTQGHPSIPPGPFCPSSSRAAGLPRVGQRSRRHLPRPPTLPHPREQISSIKARTVLGKKNKIINPSHRQRSCQNSCGTELNYICTSELNSGISQLLSAWLCNIYNAPPAQGVCAVLETPTCAHSCREPTLL